MTADCDLEQDFAVRFSPERPADASKLLNRDYEAPHLTPYVLLCNLYAEERIRGRVAGSDVWRRMKNNQDERYHKLDSAPFRTGLWFGKFPDLYLDFKKTLALPTEQLCNGLGSHSVRRVALVPHTYIHDLIHRFFGFLARVGLPD